MNAPTPTPNPAAELQSRSLDALVSLLQALDSLGTVEAVAQRALLTVSGQLLVRRAAVFVLREGGTLRLQSAVGIGKAELAPGGWRLDPDLHEALRSGGVLSIDSAATLPADIEERFEQIALLANGDTTVGILLLGGSLGKHRLDENDRQLIRTMGAVIGTTIHRVLVQEQLAQARRRNEEARLLRKSVMDHVSHEFNTPLMVVKSSVQLLQDAEGEERREVLCMLEQATDRLEQLVRSILRVNAETGEEHEVRRMGLSEFARTVIEHGVEREARGVHCFWREDPSIVIDIDPLRAEIVLKELCNNALEAADHPDPQVFVQLYATENGWWNRQDPAARLAAFAADGGRTPGFAGGDPPPPSDPTRSEVVLEVVDLGRGVPTHQLEAIFEPFSQASNSPRLGIRGAGMGLPTCQRLAHELGGRLAVRSVEGRGSLFALLLPAVPA